VRADRWKIGEDGRQIIRPDEIVDDDEIERVTAQRCGPQPIEIEDHSSRAIMWPLSCGLRQMASVGCRITRLGAIRKNGCP